MKLNRDCHHSVSEMTYFEPLLNILNDAVDQKGNWAGVEIN